MDSFPISTGDLPVAAFEKHLPVRHTIRSRPKNIYSSQSHFVRATAKRYAQSKSSDTCRSLGFPCTAISDGTFTCCRCDEHSIVHPSARRPLLEKSIAQDILGSYPLVYRRESTARNRIHRTRWCSDEVEGRDLAHSSIPLPSDRFRITRKPSFEREEAFRDASTTKDKANRGHNVNDDAEVAQLYRMGLLYDDEQDRGESFGLDSIDHEEPVYSVRPAKRSRFTKKSHSFSIDKPLHLNLSFTDLGGDQNIARFLSSSSSHADDGSLPETTGPGAREFAPLRVIYELDSSQPSFEVDTSQPPDLVSDLLSDYDCFSDSDLDDLDMPSQREIQVQDGAANPASDSWVVLGDGS